MVARPADQLSAFGIGHWARLADASAGCVVTRNGILVVLFTAEPGAQVGHFGKHRTAVILVNTGQSRRLSAVSRRPFNHFVCDGHLDGDIFAGSRPEPGCLETGCGQQLAGTNLGIALHLLHLVKRCSQTAVQPVPDNFGFGLHLQQDFVCGSIRRALGTHRCGQFSKELCVRVVSGRRDRPLFRKTYSLTRIFLDAPGTLLRRPDDSVFGVEHCRHGTVDGLGLSRFEFGDLETRLIELMLEPGCVFFEIAKGFLVLGQALLHLGRVVSLSDYRELLLCTLRWKGAVLLSHPRCIGTWAQILEASVRSPVSVT